MSGSTMMACRPACLISFTKQTPLQPPLPPKKLPTPHSANSRDPDKRSDSAADFFRRCHEASVVFFLGGGRGICEMGGWLPTNVGWSSVCLSVCLCMRGGGRVRACVSCVCFLVGRVCPTGFSNHLRHPPMPPLPHTHKLTPTPTYIYPPKQESCPAAITIRVTVKDKRTGKMGVLWNTGVSTCQSHEPLLTFSLSLGWNRSSHLKSRVLIVLRACVRGLVLGCVGAGVWMGVLWNTGVRAYCLCSLPRRFVDWLVVTHTHTHTHTHTQNASDLLCTYRTGCPSTWTSSTRSPVRRRTAFPWAR